jgi:plastocyanin domain-containing protein
MVSASNQALLAQVYPLTMNFRPKTFSKKTIWIALGIVLILVIGFLVVKIVLSQSAPAKTTEAVSSTMESGYQIIRMDVVRSGWQPASFKLKKGIPVKWFINGKELTNCNDAIDVPALDLHFQIRQGEQTIEFTPDQSGSIPWSCWMGMIDGSFVVEE